MKTIAPLPKSLSVTGFVLLSFLTPHQAIAALFTRVYVFGDSLSDTGRLYALTGNTLPVSPPYAGKLSNGPLWVEYLQQSLGLLPDPTANFALAGSTTGDNNTTIPGAIGVQQQVESFVANPPADPDALYILWAGANDYLGGGITDPAIPVANLTARIGSLYDAGARNFLVPNLPDLGRLPGTLGNLGLSGLSTGHDTLLSGAIATLPAGRPGLKITPLDTFGLFNDAIANPGKYGFTNVTDACLPTNPLGVPAGSPCINANEYIFWDAIHPSTRTHQFIGQLAATALGVPEPSVIWGLIGLGVAAVVSRPRKPDR